MRTYHIRTFNRAMVNELLKLAEQRGLSPTAKLVEYAAFITSAMLLRGTLYRAANFTLAQENAHGIQTYVRPLRPLRQHERAQVTRLATQSPRRRALRSRRAQGANQEGLW